MALSKSKSPVVPSSAVAKKAPVATQRKASLPKSTVDSNKSLSVTESEPVPADVVEKSGKKEKRVRASFRIPEAQIVALSELKARCLRLGISAKKGEMLAAAIQLLGNLPEASFAESILPYSSAGQKVPNGKMRRK